MIMYISMSIMCPAIIHLNYQNFLMDFHFLTVLLFLEKTRTLNPLSDLIFRIYSISFPSLTTIITFPFLLSFNVISLIF
jgi:hypothetical protein